MNKSTTNIFLRITPLQRILVSVTMAILLQLVFINARQNSRYVNAAFFWDVFAFTYILICWIVFFKRSRSAIKQLAIKDDGSRGFVFGSILLATIAGLFTVFVLMTSKKIAHGHEIQTLLIAVAGMILSWMMIHTLFTFHYAHLFYNGHHTETPCPLNIPSKTEPDYLDFAYFSFVIGMTFQVSDIEIVSQKIRRTVLFHSMLAFALNTFVIALSINLVASLRG